MAASAAAAVPEGFHYETKYIVLSYLGLLPASTAAHGDAQNKRERHSAIKGQIEDELRQLEDEITASFSSTGFDRYTSLVFSPANPESSIEDCLAALGDQVARDLHAHVATAVHTLLTGPLEYPSFRDSTLDVSTHTQGGWNKVLLPLVLLQALQSEGQSLATLLPLGVRFLEEVEADYIIQQGGWAALFNLEEEEERGVIIAEDSNDIYILSGEQHSGQLSPPSSLLCTGDDSGQSSWQTESLPVSLAGHESWAQVGMMDPEDVKSLDSNEGVALAEERSENNSSNSDIVHVEREEVELLEEGGEVGAIGEPELQESMMSVLGTESDLAELRAAFSDPTPPLPASSEAESTAAAASLVSLEVPVVIETRPESLSAEPSLTSSEPKPPPAVPEADAPPTEPQPAAPLPVPAIEPDPEPEPVAATAPVPVEVAPPSPVRETPTPTAPAESEPTSEPAPAPEPVTVPPQPEPETAVEPETPKKATGAPVEVESDPESELPVLLYGGAALVAIAAVVAYGAMTYRRK